jgi:hypothetical protein
LTPPYFSDELSKLMPHTQLALLQAGGDAYSRTMPKAFNETVFRLLL